jgi:methylmalonyl-CoA/ethylmalonyl-CoA epimerase
LLRAAIASLVPHHFSIAVTDIEQAMAWYQAILGFELERQFYVAGIPAKGAFLRRPELRLELWQAQDVSPVPDSRKLPDSDLRTAGTKHIAFSVPNLQSHLPELIRRGVDIAAVQRSPGEPMRPDLDPTASDRPPAFAVFIRDPCGTLIELLDRERV